MVKKNKKRAKHFTLSLRVTFKYNESQGVFEYYDDQVTDIVLSNLFHNIGFVFNTYFFEITAEYFQSDDNAMIIKVLDERMKLLKEEFPQTHIYLKINKSKPTKPRSIECKVDFTTVSTFYANGYDCYVRGPYGSKKRKLKLSKCEQNT